ncbi:ATP synthase subunit C [Clostridia bacterium]|nr:ATP synthase subunit C [Clostridia bacterium]
MKDTDYASITGYLRVLEKRLLQSDAALRLIDAKDAEETVKLLATSTTLDFSSLTRPEDYEEVIRAELKRVYAEMANLAPDKSVVDIILSKYDYHNVKVALKSKFLGKSHDRLYLDYTGISPADIKERTDKLPAHIVDALVLGEKTFTDSKDPQKLDIALDKHMFAHQRELAEKTGSEFLTEYVKLSIDFYNLKTFIRVKSMGRELGFLKYALVREGTSYDYFTQNFDKADDFGELEKLKGGALTAHIKKSKYIAFGPEILLSYIFSKENEARQIRIILTCKINNIDNEILRERLRDNYA